MLWHGLYAFFWVLYFIPGQGPQNLNRQGDQPAKIKIIGEGTIASNGKTSLNINVQIGGNPASLANLGLIRPGKGGRPGRFPGAGPRKGGRFPGKFGRRPGGFPGAGGAQPTPTPSAGAPTSGTPGSGLPTSVPPTSGPQTSGLPTSGTPAAGTPTSGTPASGTPASGTPTSGTPTSGTTPATGGGTPGGTYLGTGKLQKQLKFVSENFCKHSLSSRGLFCIGRRQINEYRKHNRPFHGFLSFLQF